MRVRGDHAGACEDAVQVACVQVRMQRGRGLELEHELASVIDTAADGEDDAHDGGIQSKGRKGEGRLLSGGGAHPRPENGGSATEDDEGATGDGVDASDRRERKKRK